jgi:hypothetical protein
MNANELEEIRFAGRIRAALNASTQEIAPDLSARLAAARRMAVSRKKADTVQTHLAYVPVSTARQWSGDMAPRTPQWMHRFGLIAILFALAISLVGVYEVQQEQRIAELADVDSAMLLDDLPPAAYADHGFHLFLKRAE